MGNAESNDTRSVSRREFAATVGTVDVRARIEELGLTTDADRRDEIVADLARVVTED